jgi:hypothetical protein
MSSRRPASEGSTAALMAATSVPSSANSGVATTNASASVAQRLKASPPARIWGSSARNCRTSPACSGAARSKRRYISSWETLASNVFPAALESSGRRAWVRAT